MAFDSKYSEYGEIKIDGSIVRLYYSSSNYDNIHAGDPVSSAEWSGDNVVIRYTDGRVRKYWSFSNYDNV